MTVVGKRTSIYLSDGLVAAVEASGVPLAELIRRGLGDAPARPAMPDEIRAEAAIVWQPTGPGAGDSRMHGNRGARVGVAVRISRHARRRRVVPSASGIQPTRRISAAPAFACL